MSGLGLDLIDPKIVAENERAPAQPSEFVRGARAGTYGMGSSLRNAIGAAADAFDFDNFAAQQFGEADRLSLRAQQTGPRIGSLEQLGREGYSLRNMGDYAAGVVGGAAPSIGLGLGASLASGGTLLPSLAAGTAAFTPFEAGDAVAKWRAANPGQQIDGQTALRLGATGVGSAAFQSVVPAMVGGKLLGHGAASAPVKSLRQAVGRNLAEIPMEGFTEGAGELIKQTGATPDAPTDWGQVGENAVAGMIGGAPMAGLGAGGDYLHGNAQAIGGAVDKGVGAVRGAADRAAGAVTGAARGAADATTPVVRDAWDGVADVAKAAYEGTVEGFKASDLGKTLGERAATVRAWAKEIIDDPATPEGIREGLRGAVAGAGNKANQAYAWAAKQARDAQTAAQEKGVKSAAADALRKLREKTDDTVDRVLNDDFLGDAATMAKATGDRVTELSQESGRKAAEFATKWGNELLDRAGVSEETKAQVAEALRNVGDRTSQTTIAAAKKAADATESVRARAKAFTDGIAKGVRDGTKDGTKKSEDYSGARQAVNDVLTKYRSEIPAAAFEDPETASMLAEGLRQFVQIAAEPGRYDTIDKHWVRAQLGSLLGPRSTDILNDVFDAVGSSDPDAVARRYEVLNDLDEMNKSSADLTGVLQAALPEGSPLAARQGDDAEVLTRWARGELTKGMPEAQAKFEDRRMQEYIQETYGDKAEVVLAALEGHAKQGRDMQHQRATADELEGEIDEFDGSTSEREDEGPDVRYIGLGAGKRLVTNPEVYRAQDKTGKPGSGDDLLEKLKERYPQADIRFVSVVEKPELIEMIPSVKGEMTKLKRKLAEQFPNDPDRQAQELEQARLAKIDELRVSGKGMFEVVNNPNEYRFTQPDIEAMRLDTERFGRKDHPSRLEVPDGPIFDAVRVAKTMMRKINRNRDWAIEDDRSDGHRLARAFSDGVAALMEEYGRFKVSPDTLIGTVNGKPFYARDIKGLEKDAGTNFSESDNRRPEHIRRKATADDAKSADELQAELDALALTIEAMELEDGDPQTLDRLYGREAKLTERLERVSMEENAQDTVEKLGQQTADPENDNIVKAGAALREGDLQRKAQAGTADSRVPNAKPLIALAERIRGSNAPAREKIADRLQTLALNIAMLSRKDQERLLDLKMAKKVSEVSGTINDLARKYADQIVAPKTEPAGYTPKPQPGERTEAQDRAKIINEVRRGKNTNVTEQRTLLRELEAQEAAGEPMGRFATEALAKLREEGPSDPKAAAAKKAAFLEKAASGDAALIKELKASTDAKGLQRAVEALNAAELTDANEANIIAAVEAINARLSELVQDPDVAYGMGTKKYSLLSTEIHNDLKRELDDELTALLAERGISVTREAVAHVPPELRVSLVNRAMKADPGAPMSQEVAKFVSWMTVGSDFFQQIDGGIRGTELEKRVLAAVNRDARQSMYSAPRKRREVVRRVVEQLLTTGLNKEYARRAPLSAKVLQVVRDAVRAVMEQLGGVKYKELQGIADRYVSGLLDGSIRLEREKKPGSALLDPYHAFSGDRNAADITHALASGREFALTGSLAYAAQGTVYRSEGAPIHDLDFITSLNQQAAEGRIEKLIPRAQKVRSFGGLGDFVSTYVVAPKDHRVDLIRVDGGVVTSFVVRDKAGRVVGRYSNVDGVESSSGAKAAIVDLIHDPKVAEHTMTIPTSMGDRQVKIADVRDAMAQKLLYARDKDIVDFANFVPKNTVHFSAQKAAGAGMSQKGQRQILDAIRTMLGNSVKVMFKNLPHAGEFERVGVDDVIRISVHALNPTTVAYHESLHAFFAKLMREGNGDIADVLMRATKRPAVAARLRELLAGEPAALKQLRDPEERAAYMFQFWANGDAKLAAALKGEPQNLLQRIAATLRKVLGIWSNEERALHIMEAFSSGEYAQNLGTPNAFHRAMMEPGRNKAIEAVRSLAKPLAELGDVMVAAGSARLRESRIPSLVELADVVKAPLTEETGDPGFVPAARLERTRVLNALGAELAGLSRDDVDAVRDILQTGNNQGTTPEQRLAARAVRKLLQDQLAYLRKAGVGVKDLGPDYFPRVYDAAYISKHQDEFRAVLDKYGVPADTMHKIIANGGTELGVEVDRPGMQAKKKRVLDMIPDAELAPFMQKDLYQILNSYVTQATRRAEWARRMGDDSARLHTLLAQAKKEGATPAQIEAAEKYVKGVNGTLGDDINPTARRLMGDMIVYQNIRLLPLAIFSSVVDPMGVLVRGGEMKDAWNTFKRGIREIPKGLRGDTSLDESARIADTLGVIDNAALVHDLGALYSQGMVGDTARKINDGFFRFNLMEQFNRSMRVGATEAALKFMERHSGGNASTHSARWMRELGLMRGDVQVVNGRVALTQADGLTAAQEARVRTAVNRWVDGAVLRPDAADKPIWMNDPHWALVAHLKQFVYAFHHTILKRVGHEMRNGNYAPAMALASYVPIMIAADVAKGMLQNGGDEPEWKKNWGLEDYVAHGVQRAGLLGVGQLGADAYTDVQRGGTGVGALVGPTFEQMGDALQVMGGHKQFGSFALRAMPANALYSGYLDEARADLSTD